MKYLIFILFFTFYCTLVVGQPPVNISKRAGEPRCFHFTWLGPFEEDKSTNCSSAKYKRIPCIKPFEISQTFPNVTDIWLNRNESEFTCQLQSGYSCIKYAYIFNQAILNISFFCGKMIEDTVSAVQTGCYSQQVGGYIIETCSCISSGFGIPCNSSSRNAYSLLGITFLTLYIIIINIK